MSIKRAITEASRPYWLQDEILLFIGPRQAGKTTILQQIQEQLIGQGESTHWISLESPTRFELLNSDPDNLFKIVPRRSGQKQIVFIDEIQYLDNPTQFLKYHYDLHRQDIKLIVSGSSAFYIDQKFKDSLVGRKRIFYVNTLSFREYLEFTGQPELAAKKSFRQLLVPELEQVSISFHDYLRYGGYPRVVLADQKEKSNILHEITYSYIKKDIFDAGVRDEDTYFKLMSILADQVGSLVNTNELATTVGVSRPTIVRYLHTMQKSFHIALVRPFSNNIRNELTKMPKVFWFDNGLRNFVAGSIEPFVTRDDKGSVLENAVFRQLLERAEWSHIQFWRTTGGQEIDFVLKSHNQAYEVKTNPRKANKRHVQAFQAAYPNIETTIVIIDKTTDSANSIPLLNIWEL
jgi:predicted AAA+ superfamily ATPase